MGCAASIHEGGFHGAVNRNKFIFAYVIGEGGFAKVMSSVHVETKTWFAVKEIQLHNALAHKTGIDMISKELLALKRVEKHPFIISLHCAFHDRAACYFVLDLVTGGDLRYHMRNRVVFSEKRTAFVVACMSSALQHVHSKGMLHRDVKPENIIFDETGYPYLADFGVAYIADSNDGDIVCHLSSGTKQYLAPEVFTKSHRHGIKSDYWALGVMAYEMIFGRRPFDKHVTKDFIAYVEHEYTLSSTKETITTHTTTGTVTKAAPPSPTGVAFVSQMNFPTDLIGDHCTRTTSEDRLSGHKQSHRPRVKISRYSITHGEISSACVRIIDGLMDVRASHRFGGDKFHLIQHHQWFADQGINWELVQKKKITAPFIPNKAQVHADLCRRFLNDGGFNTDMCNSLDEACAPVLSPEHQAIIDSVAYVSPDYLHLYPQPIPPMDEMTANDIIAACPAIPVA